MDFREQLALAPYTTFQIGGSARWFAEATTEAEVVQAVEFARARDLQMLVLGGGSNLLVADEGFPGLAVRIGLLGIQEVAANGAGRCFSVAAGEDWDSFVSFAVEQGCSGIECLAGIPGTVGGTPVQNVGAYGQEVSETIRSVRALDLSLMRFVNLAAGMCGFGYRSSIFNGSARGRYVVTGVTFCLGDSGPASLHYRDLKQYFEKRSGKPSLAEVAAAVREIRYAKGMVLVPGEEDCRSAGSFFKNPVLAGSRLGSIAAAAGIEADAVPRFSAGEGLIKVPAAWLLEKAGIHKGYGNGRAGISSRHTLALINRGGATACDVLLLRDEIVDKVRMRFGIELQMEPVLVGFR